MHCTHHHIECLDGHRLKVLVYRDGKQTTTPATGVLWIHGGGYVTGLAAMAGTMGRPPALVKKYGAVVVSPAYRIGAKGRYPNALNDCYEALRWMAFHTDELGIRPNQLFVGGESAGGGLCAALCLMARDRGEINIAFQMPLYPMIDDRDTQSSKDNHAPVWNTKRNHHGWRSYLGDLYGTDSVPAYAAPARAETLHNLPPAYSFVCTAEPFFCETLTYFEKLKSAGVDASLDIYPGLFHAFDMMLPFAKVSRRAAEAFEKAFVYAQTHYFAQGIRP